MVDKYHNEWIIRDMVTDVRIFSQGHSTFCLIQPMTLIALLKCWKESSAYPQYAYKQSFWKESVSIYAQRIPLEDYGGLTMNNDSVKELLNAVGAVAEMSLNFYRAILNAGATKEEAAVLLQSFISAFIYGSKRGEVNED